MVRREPGKPRASFVDCVLALWMVAMAALFAVSPLVATLLPGCGSIVAAAAEELQAVARGVYLIVVVMCLASVALSVVRRLTKPDRTSGV